MTEAVKDWAVIPARQKYSRLPGSQLAVSNFPLTEGDAKRLADAITAEDWKTQYEDGELFQARRVAPGTSYNTRFGSKLLVFNPSQ